MQRKILKKIWTEKDNLTSKFHRIVAHITKREKIFKTLDNKKTINQILPIIDSLNDFQIMNLPENELYALIEKIMAVELMSHMMSDLSEEQKNDFRQSIKRREFFR